MSDSAKLRSGKGSGDENFPVASYLIRPEHRAVILAFYEFVRIADDVADHSKLEPDEKLARLDRLEASLLGTSDDEASGVALRVALHRRNLSPVHAQQLLQAFRQDATKLRYENWDDLMASCRLSAMPVGRFVLDVHGESQSTWPFSDALCAALQIINHLQDCAKDYRNLNRVYLPLDILTRHGLDVEALASGRASPALRECLQDLVKRTNKLLLDSRTLSNQVNDMRLATEISVIHGLAGRLVALLKVRDPLSERVHLTKSQMLWTVMSGITSGLLRWSMARRDRLSAAK